MNNQTSALNIWIVPSLLRGETTSLRRWTVNWNSGQLILSLLIIFAGSALYGAAMGWWRGPQQAMYVAIKFPLILLFTALGNGLLNGMLAPLLGLNIHFRQSLLAVLMSFVIAAIVLGAFSPLMFFLVWNAPPITEAKNIIDAHRFILLMHVVAIAAAGLASNMRLIQLLRELSGSQKIARSVFLAWMMGNMFLGSQLSWILRPFIGSPQLPIEFLRSDAFHGNFYETVFAAVRHFLQ